MRIRIISDVLETQHDGQAVNAEFAKQYLAGAADFVVPGVTAWNNVQATDKVAAGGGAQVVIEADLTTVDVVPDGEFAGQRVCNEWVKGYILGAEMYWLAPGALIANEDSISFV